MSERSKGRLAEAVTTVGRWRRGSEVALRDIAKRDSRDEGALRDIAKRDSRDEGALKEVA